MSFEKINWPMEHTSCFAADTVLRIAAAFRQGIEYAWRVSSIDHAVRGTGLPACLCDLVCMYAYPPAVDKDVRPVLDTLLA